MNAPNNDGERQEPVSRPLSPVPLDSQSGPEPPLSQYNQPHYPPSLYDIPPQSTSHHPPPIRLFRTYNYLEANGEDLASRQYTLGPHNLYEANEDLTNAYRQYAQRASQQPQFTGTYVPSENWDPHQVAARWLGGVSHTQNNTSPPRTQLGTESEEVRAAVASNSRITLEMLPPSPNSSRSSHETANSPISSTSPITPVTPPAPTSYSRPRRPRTNRRQGSIHADKSSGKRKCLECNQTFFRKAEYDRHMKTATAHRGEGQGQFECDYCGNRFTRADARVRHHRMCEDNPNKEEGSGKGKKGKGKEKERDDEDMDEF